MTVSREEIGAIGETVARKFFQHFDSEVSMSTDQYDKEKDMIVDGENVEIKTQTIYRLFPCEDGIKRPAFTVPITSRSGGVYTNQLNKCLTVDRLVFVARPNRYDSTIRIYEAPSLGKRTFQMTVNSKDNRIVAGFLVSELKEIGQCKSAKLVDKLMDDWKFQ